MRAGSESERERKRVRMMLMGEDGRGYELARRLEGCGAWRAWLRRRGDDGGDDDDDYYYSTFIHSLSSPSAWDSFMSSPSPSPSSQMMMIHLQLRVRALLFDKASISLFLPPSSSSNVSNLNPHYLQLHGDDVYFSLEEGEEKEDQHHTIPPPPPPPLLQVQPRSGSCKGNDHPYERASTAASRYSELPENINIAQRYRHEDLSEAWPNHYFDKFKTTRYHKLPYADKESLKRTPEGMSAYLQLRERHKRKRQAFKVDPPMNVKGSMPVNVSHVPPRMIADANGSTEDDVSFFPEITFPSNCVPDTSLPLRNEVETNQKVEFNGILDNLPTVVSRSTAMMERFGIKPEYIRVGSKYRGIDGSGCEKKPLCQEQASVMTHKIVARLLANTGFEGGTGNSIEVFSEFFSNHICKLGRTLKLITDSYKKQFSSIELLQMFLQTAGYNNLGALIESIKDGNKGIITQTPQHARAIQTQHQNPLLQAQHLQRQMHPQPQNMHPSQNMTFQQQQQLEKMRRRQATTSMADVKIENTMESSPIEANTLNTFNKQQHTMQMRQQQQLQQQQMAMANHHATAAQSSPQQFRQLQSAQNPQLQMQNTYGMRAAPVKVEAFHELMGVDPTLKHEPELNKLSSPPK